MLHKMQTLAVMGACLVTIGHNAGTYEVHDVTSSNVRKVTMRDVRTSAELPPVTIGGRK